LHNHFYFTNVVVIQGEGGLLQTGPRYWQTREKAKVGGKHKTQEDCGCLCRVLTLYRL